MQTEIRTLSNPELFARLSSLLKQRLKGSRIELEVTEDAPERHLFLELLGRGYEGPQITRILDTLSLRDGFRVPEREVEFVVRHHGRVVQTVTGRWPTILTDPAWRRFERLVAALHELEQTSPAFTVEHDVAVKGASGQEHQIDVLVSLNDGVQPVRIVIQCKHLKRRVEKEQVFIVDGVRRDIGASRAIIVAENGFQSGATGLAAHLKVDLVTLEEVRSGDWTTRWRRRLIKLPRLLDYHVKMNPEPHTVEGEWRTDRPFSMAEVELHREGDGTRMLYEIVGPSLLRHAQQATKFPRFLVLDLPERTRARVQRLGLSFEIHSVALKYTVTSASAEVATEEPIPSDFLRSSTIEGWTDARAEQDVLDILLRDES